MADDVRAAERHPTAARHVAEPVHRIEKAAATVGGRSICVVSPEITIFEPKPSRVRNIFIWDTVVFWASSRMMKA